MKICISGSHGLIGCALKERFLSDAHQIVAFPRDFSTSIDFTGIDAVIHLAGEPIAEGRWNTVKKRRIKDSRVIGTRRLVKQIITNSSRPSVFISASAIGFYGDRGEEMLDEESAPGKGFLPDVCKAWEEAANTVREAGIRTVNVRFGMVLSAKGGALKKMLPACKAGAGCRIGNGRQYISWVSIEDVVGCIDFLIKRSTIDGAVNLVAPVPVTNAEFSKTLGQVLHRPSILPLPAFAARTMFGEMADALLLSSARVYPKKLLGAGCAFTHADLRRALESLLKA